MGTPVLVVVSVGRFSLVVVPVFDVKAGTEPVSLDCCPPVGVMTTVPLVLVVDVLGVLEAAASDVSVSFAVLLAVVFAGVDVAGVEESAAAVDFSVGVVAALVLVVFWVAGVLVALALVVESAAMALAEKRDTATTAESRSVRFSETRDRPIFIAGLG